MLPTILMNKYVLGGLLGLSLLAGAFILGHSRGRAGGLQDGKLGQLELDKQVLDAQQKDFKAFLEKSKADQEALEKQIADLKDQANLSEARIVALTAVRTAGQQQVAKLPDSDLEADVKQKLGLRVQGDTAPMYPQEWRKLDSIVTDYEPLKKASDEQGKQLELLRATVEKQGQDIKLISDRADKTLESWNELHRHYVVAYNAAQKKHSLFVKIITAGLVRDKHLDIPNPLTLESPK